MPRIHSIDCRLHPLKRKGGFDVRVLLGGGALLYVCWNAGTAAGVLLGDVVGDPNRLGLDAAFPALFLALLDGWLKTIDNAIEASRGLPVPETFQRIAESFPYIFATAGGNLPMFMEFWLQASRDQEIWQASVAPYRRYHKEFTALIQRGIDDGLLRRRQRGGGRIGRSGCRRSG